MPLAQSSPPAHASPAQARHIAPPQSTPVSAPFCTASVHVGAWQVSERALHTPSAQSAPVLQSSPTLQPGHVPPQSTSLSVPFFTPSLHSGSSVASRAFTTASTCASTWFVSPVVVQIDSGFSGVCLASSFAKQPFSGVPPPSNLSLTFCTQTAWTCPP